MRQAKKLADECFPFGNRKAVYFWNFVVVIMLFALGSGLSIYKGISHTPHPKPDQGPSKQLSSKSLTLRGGFIVRKLRATSAKATEEDYREGVRAIHLDHHAGRM